MDTNPQHEIESLLRSTEKKPSRKLRPRYNKPQSIKDFEIDYRNWYYANRNIPKHIQVLTKFRDDHANNLTKLIVAFLRVKGAFATRLNSTGIYRNDLAKYVPNTQRKGMADIIATYRGLSLNIEVKIGRDRMSTHQEKVKREIESSGGQYFIASDFEGFLNWFKGLSNLEY